MPARRRPTDWVEVRTLAFLEVDPEWATTLDEVRLGMLDARIDGEMTVRVGARPEAAEGLPDFEVVRAANGRPLRDRITEARRVVLAWCDREGVQRPEAWTLKRSTAT